MPDTTKTDTDKLSPLLRERYRGDAEAVIAALEQGSLGTTGNDVLATMLGNRSVRGYLPDTLAPGFLEAMIAGAQSASTSSNIQAWSVVAVEDPARKDRLSKLVGNQSHVRNAPVFLVWLADLARLDYLGQRMGAATGGLEYLEALVVGIVDTTLAAQNAATVARSLGLGTVYIGGIRNDVEAVAEELDLPRQVMPVFGMCVGYPDPARPTSIKPRLPQETVLHRETYSLAKTADLAERYNATMRDFQAEQNMTQLDWTRQATNRVRGPEALSGRDVLREALIRLGFGLR